MSDGFRLIGGSDQVLPWDAKPGMRVFVLPAWQNGTVIEAAEPPKVRIRLDDGAVGEWACLTTERTPTEGKD